MSEQGQGDRVREVAWREFRGGHTLVLSPITGWVSLRAGFDAGYDAATRALAEELAAVKKQRDELAVNGGIGPIRAEVWARSEDVKSALFEKVRTLEARLAEREAEIERLTDGWRTCEFDADELDRKLAEREAELARVREALQTGLLSTGSNAASLVPCFGTSDRDAMGGIGYVIIERSAYDQAIVAPSAAPGGQGGAE